MNSSLVEKDDSLQQERKLWHKEMKEEMQEKEKIKRLLKQTEKRAIVETKHFEDKLKKYEDEVATLKSRIDSAKKGKRVNSSLKKSPRKSHGVTSIYSSSAKEGKEGRESVFSLLESKLEEESRTKKNL